MWIHEELEVLRRGKDSCRGGELAIYQNFADYIVLFLKKVLAEALVSWSARFRKFLRSLVPVAIGAIINEG